MNNVHIFLLILYNFLLNLSISNYIKFKIFIFMCKLTKISQILLQKINYYGILFVRFDMKGKIMTKKNFDMKHPSPPKTKVGLSKMNKLIESAEELFTKNGFYQTSIADICRKAETAVGTFYIYFESKTDIYHYMMKSYEADIKKHLADAIENCTTRYEKEREGIKSFIKYAVNNPNVYNIIWGSLSVDKQLFVSYYESFSKAYAHALTSDKDEMRDIDATAIAYMLMGMSNFLGLRALFENMSEEDIDKMIDESLMPALSDGIFSKTE